MPCPRLRCPGPRHAPVDIDAAARAVLGDPIPHRGSASLIRNLLDNGVVPSEPVPSHTYFALPSATHWTRPSGRSDRMACTLPSESVDVAAELSTREAVEVVERPISMTSTRKCSISYARNPAPRGAAPACSPQQALQAWTTRKLPWNSRKKILLPPAAPPVWPLLHVARSRHIKDPDQF